MNKIDLFRLLAGYRGDVEIMFTYYESTEGLEYLVKPESAELDDKGRLVVTMIDE